MRNEFSQTLRAWRERLTPENAGLARTSTRTPGLRREEVAVTAGVSVNYLTRLEQGRAVTPSPSVVAALARALHLDAAETAHLHQLAGNAAPLPLAASRQLTPAVQRILDRLDDVPVIVVDATWTILAANEMAEAFFSAELVGENAVRRQFLGPFWAEREQADEERYERDLVGDLHATLARHPSDESLTALISELRARSERFASLWAERPAGFAPTTRKTFHHPTAGRITVDCDVLETPGSDVRLVIWTAASDTSDADALKTLAAH
ncbi:helix-turn-helix protein [Glaciihabitans tibetensis]|uniref:Helix-turn-helix protein n=1 Tax=Glaciihabitans tibetensis TaxID=1266600 RepID=A0A2T0V758_9MICO|nr:helix-turn-helix transcriptional regulator [Glaciihabitans tibetensis]PRY65888.1 helix-turn-helix protein [Glaciihabitans tibetensis]